MYDYAYADTSGFGLAALGAGFWILLVVYYIVCVVALWRMFRKAGVPGWTSIIPIVNTIMIFKISWGRAIWFLLCFVPIVNIVILIMTYYKLSKAFGHGIGFFFLLLFLPVIFYLVVGLGSSEYHDPKEQ